MSIKLPRISIVTPSFNQGQYIEQTIRSVLSQDYPDLEYIIMDGGSTDNTLEIIKKYESQLSHWQSQPDKGQADAINKGFALTSGEVMGWLNSDDILFPGSLHLIGKIFAAYPEVQWVTGWKCSIDFQNAVTGIRPREGIIRALLWAGWYHGRGLGFIGQEATFWRRALWEKAGGYVDVQRFYSMDYELWRRFSQHSGLVVIDTILAGYREQPDQKTTRIDEYYREIGVWLPQAVRLLMLPVRIATLLVTWLISSRITYDRRTCSWHLRKGPFFDQL